MERKKIYISQVHPNEGQIEGLPANPRLIKDGRFKKLVKSIQDLPEMTEARDLLVYPYEGGYIVIGGNMRLRAYQELGWKEVPCCVLPENMPVDKLREMVIQDNNPFGETDWNMIANEWDVEELKDWGVDLPADWDTSEAEEQKEAEEDDFSDEDAEKAEPRVKPGEIWQLGEHRLMCGDSTDSASVALLMDGNKADMVFTDPPYGMKKESEGVLNDNLNREELGEFNNLWIPISISSLKDNGSWYCWGIDEILMDIYSDILRPMIYDRKLSFRNLITWDKGSGQGQKSDGFKLYPIADEKCLFVVRGAATLSSGVFRTKEYFFEGFSGIRDYLRGELEKSGLSMKEVIGMTSTYASHYFALSQWAFPTEKDYNTIREHCRGAAFQKEYAELQKEYAELQKEYAELQKEYAELLPYFDNTHDNMNNVWHFERARYTDNDSRINDLHATPKPVQLCARAIKSSSREGESVLDLFGGSGSTLIACEQLNRKCHMMELAHHYCDVIIARWEKLTGKEAVKVYG